MLAIASVSHTPFNSHDHVRDRNGVQYNYMEVVVYIATLAGLVRPYEESVLGSYTVKKGGVSSHLVCIGLIGVSAPSLHIESTDSMIAT